MTQVTEESAVRASAGGARKWRRYALYGVSGVLILMVGGIGFLALNWPFKRQRLIDAMQEASARSVLIGRFHSTYFPPGCVAEDIQFLHRQHKEKAPLITIARLTVRGSYSAMLRSRYRLSSVVVDGMHVTVPPPLPDGSSPIMPLTDVKGGKP
ncbi:MAG: hypothetical protein JO022_15410, partial [Acidobacteriaceae bacterium]|nr:hypothetical protein [Acidobacteriaceae bacterium]